MRQGLRSSPGGRRATLPSLALLAAAAWLATPAIAAPGTIVKPTSVYAKPFLDAPVVSSLKEKAVVDILGADGAWTQVRTADGQTGWVRLLNVRPAASGSSSGVKGLLTAGNVVRTGSTGSTATTGAKGISKEDLDKAQPNFDEAKRLDSYRASPDDGRQYATGARLQAQRVEPLPTTP